MTVVSIYLFILAATAIWYLLFVSTDIILANYPLASEIRAVNIVLIISSAAGGILLLREGWIWTGYLASETVLIFWVLVIGYVVLALVSLGPRATLSGVNYLIPVLFPFSTSLAMAMVLYVGWKKTKG